MKCAKYVGTMIGSEGHIHRWNAGKIIQRTKFMILPRVSWRDGDFKVYALSVPWFSGSFSAPDEGTLKDEAHALHCTTAGLYNAIPTNLLRVVSVCGLGPDVLEIHTLSLAARNR